MREQPNILIIMVDQLNGTLFPDGPADWLHTPKMEPYLGLNRIEDNLVFEEFAEAGFVDADNLGLQLREDSPVYERLPEFERIPFERIGLFTDEFRRQLP